MASSRFFPSRVQSLARTGKLLAFQVAPNGSGTPTLGSREGVASVARTGAGAITVTLQDQYRALIDGQCSLQLAAAPAAVSASYTWTDATDTDVTQFIAGPSFPGALGNNLKVIVATGGSLSSSVAYAAGIWTVTLQLNTGTTTPALLKTYVNTTAAATLGGFLTIGTATGTTPYSVFLASTALTGGVAAALGVQLGAIDVVTNKTVKLVVYDGAVGTGFDIAANAGNLINVELFLQTE